MPMNKEVTKRLNHLCFVMLLLVGCMAVISSAQAQGTSDTTTTRRQIRAPNWDEGVLIDLGEVQIEGEIAQPNVVISHARQKPQFRELSLKRTPTEGLTNLDITAQDAKSLAAARIKNWTEILDRPRD
ncbi:MAG: hypothetical protein NTW14_12705 [bacterium]|nr:hypothetical protein [bacterium]